METNPKLIKKLVKEKNDENWSFRSFLKSYDNNDIDSIVQGLYKQFSETIDCTTCGNCCKEIKPSVNKTDIEKLSNSIKITPDKFIADFVEKDEDGEDVIRQIPCPFLSEKRCTQYVSRPAECASYPHLHKKGFAFRLVGVVINASICPIVFNVYEALKPNFKLNLLNFNCIFSTVSF
jgi:Fe-S-cluster containining protein